MADLATWQALYEPLYTHPDGSPGPLLRLALHGILVDRAEMTRRRIHLFAEQLGVRRHLLSLLPERACRACKGKGRRGRLVAVGTEPCDNCAASGRVPGKRPAGRACPACKGSGQSPRRERPACPDCSGSGRRREGLWGEKGNLSAQRVQDYLAEGLGLRRGSADELALLSLREKAKPDVRAAIDLLLADRRHDTLKRFLDPSALDPDDRARSAYHPLAESMRMRCSSNPLGTGWNLQAFDKDAQSCFVPDPGCVFLNADLSGAEDRVVRVLTRDPELCRQARDRDFDPHRRRAARAYQVSEAAVTPAQRQMAKRLGHGTNYGAMARKVLEIIIRDLGEFPPLTWVEAALARSLDAPVRDVFQRDVRVLLGEENALTNSWGLRWDVRHERHDEDLWRRAYAWRPQSEITTLLTTWGFIPLDQLIHERNLQSRINQHGHDGLLISCPPGEVEEIARFLVSALERPRDYATPWGSESLTVPVTLALGRTWGDLSLEWKSLPTPGVLERAAHSLLDEKRSSS